MNLYERYILPKAVHWACSQSPYFKQREKIIPKAKGNVLEVGIGTGLNLNFYVPEQISRVVGIDPSKEVWNEGKVNTDNLPFPFEFIKASAENIPVEKGIFDTVVTTYTMCTIPNLKMAFQEFKRVLKPDGILIFCEHGKAPQPSIEKWQHRINPVWKKFSGGCNLNRDIPSVIKNNGFKINEIEKMYIPGWKIASYNYWGIAMKL